MNARHMHNCAAALLLGAALFGGSTVLGQARPDEPETVMITLHAKGGAEAELAQVIARHWATAQRLKMVRDTPHITLRAPEEGAHTYFVEIMTWRDASVPDSAPPEIQQIWADMNRLVEKRGGRPGLNIEAVSVVTEKP